MRSAKAPAYLALLGTVVLFGTSFPAIRRGLGGYSPGQMALLRLTVASVALGLVAARFGLRRPSRRQLAELAAVGFFGMAAYQLLLNSGERRVPAGPASLLVNLSPVFTAVLANVLFSERLPRRAKLGVAIGCSGGAMVALGSDGSTHFNADALLVLGAAVSQTAYFVSQRPLLSHLGARDVTTWAMWFGTLMTLPLAGGLPHAIATARGSQTAAVIFLGVGVSAVGFVLWSFACTHLPVSFAASCLYGVPPIAIVTGWVVLGERPGALAVGGGAVALTGVALVSRASARPRTASDP